MSAIVRDYRKLKAMERRGFIITRDGHQRHWTGYTVRNYFVKPGDRLENWYTPFEYKGIEYRIKYFDDVLPGCVQSFAQTYG